MGANPFGEFETKFQNTEAADPAAAPGRVPEETYKFVCTAIDVKGDGVLADHEIFVTPQGTKGFKIYGEILEPVSVMNPRTKTLEKTKGQVIEKVFWVTEKNLPYIKRDLATVLGREFRKDETLGDVCMNTAWAGRTFEGVVRDDTYKGFTRSLIAFINAWAPKAEAGPNPHGAAAGKDAKPPADQKPVAGTEQKKSDAPAAAPAGAPGSSKPGLDF